MRPDQPTVAMTAAVAGQRLDEALRGFLADQGSKRVTKQDLWRLVGGTLRLRLTARAVAEMPGDADAVESSRDALERRTITLESWYERLADLVGKPDHRPVAALDPPSFGASDIVRSGSDSYYGVWLCEHLNHLSEQLGDLVQPAVRVAELRRQPWWR
jgi:hypothetical protein